MKTRLVSVGDSHAEARLVEMKMILASQHVPIQLVIQQ